MYTVKCGKGKEDPEGKGNREWREREMGEKWHNAWIGGSGGEREGKVGVKSDTQNTMQISMFGRASNNQ